MHKVLLTGANGFLGSHIAESLSEAHYTVSALIRRRRLPQLEGLNNVSLVRGDICDRDSLADIVKDVDYVVHCAGRVKARNKQDFFAVNATGTQNLLDAIVTAKNSLKRFILISSLAAAGPNLGENEYISTDQANPVSNYGKSKLAGEQIALSFQDHIPITIIRPPIIYGPRDKEFLNIIKLIEKRIWPTIFADDHRFSVIHVKDAANAVLHAIEHDKNSGNIYFISNNQTHTIAEIKLRLAELLAVKKIYRLPISWWQLRGIAFLSDKLNTLFNKTAMLNSDKLNEMKQKDWTCNNSQAKKQLQWKPEIHWDNGIKETVLWYQQQGWVKKHD